MQLLHEGAEEAEIKMGGGAEGCAVGGAVHGGDVGADGQVNGDRDAQFVGGGQDAGVGVGDVDHSVVEELAGGFAVAEAGAHGDFGDLIQIFAGFGGHAEGAGTETGLDVFGSVAGQGDLEIVDQGGAVHGERGDEAAAHEVDEDRAESDFDYMAAYAPEDGFALLAGGMDGGQEIAEVGGGEEVGEGGEEFVERRIVRGRLGEIANADFALSRCERVSVEMG